MLFTIGYEKSGFTEFAETLSQAGVTSLIDVRAQPHSRRREFAYKHLGPALGEYGIGYESWPVLGAPETARDAARRGDTATFNQVYEAHLDKAAAQQVLTNLIELARTESPCMMCYERDPRQCHRLLIGERIQAMADVEVRDLFPSS